MIGNDLTVGGAVGKHIENQSQEVARNLERAFISEMLSFVGMDAVSGKFGGGDGEAQFQSFLRDEYAQLIAEQGGLGLAKHFEDSLRSRE